ncbi:MAG: hypothetical protein ACI4PU_09945 [Intestinibacter sp.]
MFKIKTNNLLDGIVYIIMAIIYCSVAAYFVSIRTNIVHAVITILSFVVGAIAYFKLSFRKAADESK